jgi:hypothetical protein
MKKIASKAIPVICAITAPFFVSAEEQAEANMLCAASNKPAFGGAKVATTTSSSSSSSANNAMMNGQITPPTGPTVQNGADVFITADFIYWKAQVSGLEYAFTGGVAGGGYTSQTNATSGHMHAPDFDYQPGFKVGLGVLTNHDNWDVYAEYTWLHAPSHDSRDDIDSSDVIQGVNTWGYLGVSPVYGTETDAAWDFHFNVLDVEIGRGFWISKRLALRPHLGMKFSWLKQDYDIHGRNVVTNGVSTTNSLNYDFDLKQFGVGVRTGLDSAYYLANKWSIFGDLAITGLWNRFKSHREDTYVVPGTGSFKNSDVHEHSHALSTVIELDLGLRFETIFGKGKYKYMLQAGWETQMWFDQGQFIRFTANDVGNLSMQGLTIKTGFWF